MRFREYATVGLSTFVLDMVLIIMFVHFLNVPQSIAIGAAFLIAVNTNYLLQHFWVYKHSHETPQRTYPYFISLALLATLLIPTLVMIVEDATGLSMLTARVIVGGALGVFGFCFNTFFNFKHL